MNLVLLNLVLLPGCNEVTFYYKEDNELKINTACCKLSHQNQLNNCNQRQVFTAPCGSACYYTQLTSMSIDPFKQRNDKYENYNKYNKKHRLKICKLKRI